MAESGPQDASESVAGSPPPGPEMEEDDDLTQKAPNGAHEPQVDEAALPPTPLLPEDLTSHKVTQDSKADVLEEEELSIIDPPSITIDLALLLNASKDVNDKARSVSRATSTDRADDVHQTLIVYHHIAGSNAATPDIELEFESFLMTRERSGKVIVRTMGLAAAFARKLLEASAMVGGELGLFDVNLTCLTDLGWQRPTSLPNFRQSSLVLGLCGLFSSLSPLKNWLWPIRMRHLWWIGSPFR